MLRQNRCAQFASLNEGEFLENNKIIWTKRISIAISSEWEGGLPAAFRMRSFFRNPFPAFVCLNDLRRLFWNTLIFGLRKGWSSVYGLPCAFKPYFEVQKPADFSKLSRIIGIHKNSGISPVMESFGDLTIDPCAINGTLRTPQNHHFSIYWFYRSSSAHILHIKITNPELKI